MSTATEPTMTGVDRIVSSGLDVYTIDNKRLGRVKETTATHFKVDARFRRDYWLTKARIVYLDDRCIGMHFRKDELDLYRMSDPYGLEFANRTFERPKPARDRIVDPDVRGGFPL